MTSTNVLKVIVANGMVSVFSGAVDSTGIGVLSEIVDSMGVVSVVIG